MRLRLDVDGGQEDQLCGAALALGCSGLPRECGPLPLWLHLESSGYQKHQAVGLQGGDSRGLATHLVLKQRHDPGSGGGEFREAGKTENGGQGESLFRSTATNIACDGPALSSQLGSTLKRVPVAWMQR